MLSGKKILVGITGAIAGYKIYDLIRLYKKNNATVKVVLTPHSLEFMSVLVLQTLSGNPVFIKQFETENLKPEHISLTDNDIFVLAPASANTIGKIANGICDNLLTSTFCAFKNPVIVAPSMNCGMWDNCFMQENIEKLKQHNYNVLEPEEGFLACGVNGKGRLIKIEHIFEKTLEVLNVKT